MRGLLVGLVLLLAAPAFAAAGRGAPAPDYAAEARALLERTHAAEFFDVAPSDTAIVVRHRASGLVCTFQPGEPAEITIYPESAYGAARGEDVSCNTFSGGRIRTLYATRYPRPVPIGQALDETLAEIFDAYPRVHRIAGPAETHTDDILIASRTAHLEFPSFHGVQGPAYSRASVAVVGGWVILMRYTGPRGRDSEQAAQGLWDDTLRALQDRPGDSAL